MLSEGMRWMKLDEIEQRNGKTALPKYMARFGSDWVEIRVDETGVTEVRLKPLGEVRPLVEVAGEFLMMPSEEITDEGVHQRNEYSGSDRTSGRANDTRNNSKQLTCHRRAG